MKNWMLVVGAVAIVLSVRVAPARDVGTTFISVDVPPEGDVPVDALFSGDGTTLLVVNRDSDNVTFFDVQTRTILDVVDVGARPVDIALVGGGVFAATADLHGDTVSVIEVATRTLWGQIPMSGSRPHRIEPIDDQRALVGVMNDGIDSSFSIVDPFFLDEESTLPSAPQRWFGSTSDPWRGLVFPRSTQFAVTPDGTRVILPDRFGATIWIYDLASGLPIAELPTEAMPATVAFDGFGFYARVAHGAHVARVSLVNLLDNSIVEVQDTVRPLACERIAVDPSLSLLLMPAREPDGSSGLQFMNTTGDILDFVPTADWIPRDFQLAPDGQHAIMLDDRTLHVIDVPGRARVASRALRDATRAAIALAGNRAAAVSPERESVAFATLAGGSSTINGVRPSGPGPEGDGPRRVAVTPDGLTAVTANVRSGNVSIIDLQTDMVRATVGTGAMPTDLAIAPNGGCAVVSNREANTVSIVDLAADAVVAAPAVPVPAALAIAPDSTTAYVVGQGEPPRLHFIDLAGPASAITGTLEIGTLSGYSTATVYEPADIALSPDGAVLAIPETGGVRLVDTAARTTLVVVDIIWVGTRATFSPDGSRLFVVSPWPGAVVTIVVDGASSFAATATITDKPIDVVVDADGTWAYVADALAPVLLVLDAATGVGMHALPVFHPQQTLGWGPDGALYVATAEPDEDAPELVTPRLLRMTAAGPASTIDEIISPAAAIHDLAASATGGVLLLAEPAIDGVEVIRFGGCAPDVNGNGEVDVDDLVAVIVAWGTDDAAADVDDSGEVDVDDLVAVIVSWGPCP